MRSEEIRGIRGKYGSNRLTKRRRRSFFSHFLTNLNDPIIRILLTALLLNVIFSFGHPNIAETAGVAAAVFIATLVSTVSEYSSCRAAEKLSERESGCCPVRRDGTAVNIPVDEVVTGDVVLLSSGMSVPADGILIEGGLYCDQSSLTGEGKEVRKTPCPLLTGERYIDDVTLKQSPSHPSSVFRGTTVTSGEGAMAVLRVGDRTLYGTVAADLQKDAPESPLKKKLSVLAGEISIIGYIAAAMVAFSYLFSVFVAGNGFDMTVAVSKLQNTPYLLHELLSAVTLAVSVLVVAVPEGLPMMITVVLSSNLKKMLRGGVLVKRMVGIETAGGMSVLFTDKTGTLTEGRMSVRAILTSEGEYTTLAKLRGVPLLYRHLHLSSSALPPEGGGNFTDRAVLSFFGGKTDGTVTARIPFESENRYAACTVRDDDGRLFTYLRGAPEVILEKCGYEFSAKGENVPFHPEKITEKWHSLTATGARVIAVAVRDGDDISLNGKSGPFTLLSLISLADPLRKDAAASVGRATAAGIRVIMMTGDNIDTAASVAQESGILKGGGRVISAEELRGMDDRELSKLIPHLSVIARALPSDKLRVVRAARDAGLISGMTGDGVNDAPALRLADVGFAMGSGTDVAKEAGDLVITDDSISSIIKAVLYGRTVFRSIRKFITFQLTMNLCATAVTFISPFLGIESPVTIIQMLWVNLIMDTLGALAFAGEAPRDEYMKSPPFPSDARILQKGSVISITVTAFYMTALSLLFLFSPYFRGIFGGFGRVYFLTAFFAFFIFCGISLSFSCRSPRVLPFSGLTKNPAFIIIMTAVAAVQLGLVYFGGTTFRCTPLLPIHLFLCFALSLTVIPVGGLVKLLLPHRLRDK